MQTSGHAELFDHSGLHRSKRSVKGFTALGADVFVSDKFESKTLNLLKYQPNCRT